MSGGITRVSNASAEHERRYERDAEYRARSNEAVLYAMLSRVWASLARELAKVLAHLVTTVETRDLAGRLWLVGVDGVRESRDSPVA